MDMPWFITSFFLFDFSGHEEGKQKGQPNSLDGPDLSIVLIAMPHSHSVDPNKLCPPFPFHPPFYEFGSFTLR